MLDIENRGLKLAIHQMGTRSELARALDVSRQAVTNWITEGVPPARAYQIHKLTGVNLAWLMGE